MSFHLHVILGLSTSMLSSRVVYLFDKSFIIRMEKVMEVSKLFLVLWTKLRRFYVFKEATLVHTFYFCRDGVPLPPYLCRNMVSGDCVDALSPPLLFIEIIFYGNFISKYHTISKFLAPPLSVIQFFLGPRFNI